MHRYEVSTPRVALGIAAVAMAAMTMGVLVVMPASMEIISHEPRMFAAPKVTTSPSTHVVTGATIDIVAVHKQGLATVRAHRTASHKVEMRGSE